jgi:hypothetical protein
MGRRYSSPGPDHAGGPPQASPRPLDQLSGLAGGWAALTASVEEQDAVVHQGSSMYLERVFVDIA